MIKNIVDGVWIKEDGAEVCTAKALREYQRRTAEMADRQRGRCAICGVWMALPTFDHENGRGSGKRDDRIAVNGRWQNAAVHLTCNQQKGSKRTPYQITQETSR